MRMSKKRSAPRARSWKTRTRQTAVRGSACFALSWMSTAAFPIAVLASEAKEAAGEAAEGALGPPALYSIQWMLLLMLLAVTVLFVIVSLAPEMRRRARASRAKTILAFSAMQILLVIAILVVNFLGEEYHEPALPGYIRHVTLIATGILLSISGLMARRGRG